METGVMKIREFDDGSTVWRTACSCMCQEHDCELFFEVDEWGGLELSISNEMGLYPYYDHKENKLVVFWKNLTRRVDAAFKILTTGRYTMTGNFLFDKNNIDGFQYALAEGKRIADERADKRAAIRKAKLANKAGKQASSPSGSSA